MKRKRPYLYLFFIIVLFLAFLFFVPGVVMVFWKGLHIPHEPLHATLEATGAVVAMLITVFLLRRRSVEYAGKLFLVGMGFLSMGILDGLHAVSKPGNGFVLLRSAAGFAGGFWFALTWIKGLASDEDKNWRKALPWIVIAGSFLFGFIALFDRESLPVMVQEGEFTNTAVAINLMGGVLYIVAAVRLFVDFHYSERFIACFFACVSILFAAAGLNFPYSTLWNIEWWLWHIERLLAYLMVFGFAVYEYNNAVIEAEAYFLSLEAMNKELEAFSYSVSHDLRTPLRAIDGFSHILLDEYQEKLDDEGRRLLNVVRDNTKKMGQLIDDMLAFSRAGRQGMQKSEIDMGKLVRDVCEELKSLEPGRDLKFDVKPLSPAYADRATMRMVLVNLLSNSIKFTRPKETAIVEAGGWTEGVENIYYVKDNGAGFDMRYAGKLFGVFQRLHTAEEFEGTGIGLAIVKRIVARHGGRVWAESKINEGATLFFTLPKKEAGHE